MIKQFIRQLIPVKVYKKIKDIKLFFLPNKYDSFIKTIQGIPYDDTVLEKIREFIKSDYDIYNLDEETSKSLADSWKGVIEKPKNIRFIEKSIPVVLSANDDYAHYTAVMLQSLLDNSNPERKYHFFIFERDFTDNTKKYLTEQVSNFPHCFIEFISVKHVFNNVPIFAPASHISLDTFSRLLIPYWLTEYHKVIYLDSDMIAKADIAQMFDYDISDKCIAAVPWSSQGVEKGDYSQCKPLISRVFPLHADINNYFNDGVLLLNTKKIREFISYEQIFRFAIYYTNRYIKRFNNQDIMNYFFGESCYKLSEDWNYIWSDADKKGRNYKPSSANTKIIHFTSPIKPWKDNKKINKNPDVIFYREYAEKVLLYNLRKGI